MLHAAHAATDLWRRPAYVAAPFSGHRQELSIAFSEDDGATWSAPQVIIRKQDYGISYPYLFELEPGRIWLSTQYCYRMALTFSEQDFVGHNTRQRSACQ